MGLKKKTRKAGKRDGRAPKVKFGRLYRDDLTGFEGRCAGFTSYISGCDQVLLVPKVDKDGKHQYGHWFDDDRPIDVDLEQRVERTRGDQSAPDIDWDPRVLGKHHATSVLDQLSR
jgi:hypothetical protein